jgi:hypothetical protein
MVWYENIADQMNEPHPSSIDWYFSLALDVWSCSGVEESGYQHDGADLLHEETDLLQAS